MRIVLLFLMSVCAFSSWAGDVNALMLHLASGKQVICMLEERPVVTFVGEELKLTTHMNVMSYLSADVLQITYLYADPSDIAHLGSSQSIFSFTGDVLSVRCAEPNMQISVFSADGELVASAKTNKRGTASIVLSDHACKIFVIKTSIANFKITKP